MRITQSRLNPAVQSGPELVLTVDGLTAEPHTVLVPLAALPNRRLLYSIDPCQPGHETCLCGVCVCCTDALEAILAEHYARLNPDRLADLDAPLAAHLVRLGAVPGKVWDEQAGQIRDSAPGGRPAAFALRARGGLVGGAP